MGFKDVDCVVRFGLKVYLLHLMVPFTPNVIEIKGLLSQIQTLSVNISVIVL